MTSSTLDPTSLDAASIASAKEAVSQTIAEHRDELLAFDHALHDDPEISYEEHRAAGRVADLMAAAGFEVATGVYGLPTAVEAVYGSGDFTVTICAEYDALPGIGHACGHNIIATAGVGAAIALKPLADQCGMRVKLLGTPAEEHGGGKVDLLRAGAWEDSTISLMVHGSPDGDVPVQNAIYTAVERYEVTFHGVEAHAAGAPEQAINASAAATLALTALALLRQHIPASANTNAYVSHGGDATNIIAGTNVLQLEVRAGDLDTFADLKRRVLACFEGAAIATGCTWEHHRTENPYAPVDNDPDLAALWNANLEATGRTLRQGVLRSGGSTDMGNVCQVLPAVHGSIAIKGCTAVPHQAAFAAAAVTPAGDEAALDGATAIAWTAVDAALTPALRAAFLRRQADRPAGCTTRDRLGEQ